LSTARPLPLQPLPPSTVSEAETRALRQEVTSRLAEHRQRYARSAATTEGARLIEDVTPARRSRIASSVAARFSQSVSYRDFLEQEAHAAIQQAEAEAEVARRSAEAIVAVQQQLLDEIDQWNQRDQDDRGPADVLPMPAANVVEAEPLQAAPVAEVEAIVQAKAEVLPEIVAQVEAVAVTPVAAPAPDVASLLLEQLPSAPTEPATPLPTNLIEFPRQLVAARRARPRLAEGPLREEADASPERAQLRIFEVEASSVSTAPPVESVLPEWHNIRLGAHVSSRETASPEAQISFALPLYVAPGSLRLMAMAVDGCCIATSFLLAVGAASWASPVLPTGLPAVLVSGVSLLVFALFYQLLFFSLGDATPGMRYARIGLCTFSDDNPTKAVMLRRIGAQLLAGMPVGLGFLWACLDEEGLGWHDRISRTYLRAY
jgi:hypothetical protein